MAYTLMHALSLAVVVMVTVTSALPTDHVVSKRAVLLDDHFAPVSSGGSSGGAVVEVLGVEDSDAQDAASGSYPSLARTKRGHHHLPIWVNTFQMTDHHANFKWGVRHNVGY